MQQPMIRRIKWRSLQGDKKTFVELFRPTESLTVMIGDNASGRGHLLAPLRFLSSLKKLKGADFDLLHDNDFFKVTMKTHDNHTLFTEVKKQRDANSVTIVQIDSSKEVDDSDPEEVFRFCQQEGGENKPSTDFSFLPSMGFFSSPVEQNKIHAEIIYQRLDTLKTQSQSQLESCNTHFRKIFPDFGGFLELENKVDEWHWSSLHRARAYSWRQLSYGCFQYLYLTTLLLQPRTQLPDVLVLEYPENCLAPPSLAQLAIVIKEASQNIQLIVKTNDRVLANCLGTKQLMLFENGGQFGKIHTGETKEANRWLERQCEPDQETLPEIDRQVNHRDGISYHDMFFPYLYGAKKIDIIDPYIHALYQMRNLLEFLNVVRQAATDTTEVTLETTRAKYLESQQEWLEKIKNISKPFGILFNWKFNDNLKQIHDRYVRADTGWEFVLGRGLDIFGPYNTQDILQFEQMDQVLRGMKDFSYRVKRKALASMPVN